MPLFSIYRNKGGGFRDNIKIFNNHEYQCSECKPALDLGFGTPITLVLNILVVGLLGSWHPSGGHQGIHMGNLS